MTAQYTLQEIAGLTGAQLKGSPERVITGVGPLDTAGPQDLSFLANPKYREQLAGTRAGAVILPPRINYPGDCLISENPYRDFAKVVARFAPAVPLPEGIHDWAVVHPTATLGQGVAVGPFCVIGPGVRIGDRTVLTAHVYVGDHSTLGEDCVLFPGVVIRERIQVGNRVLLHPGVVLGADGFGFAPDGDRYLKIPQIGTVVIEDDVELGANVTVDRAALGETRIGHGSKLDNLIMVAHNVTIGPNTVIAGQTGLSGSTQIGSHVMIGGQVGTAGHLKVGDNAVLGAQSGIMRDVPPGHFVFGYPAQPHQEYMRQIAEIKRLPELAKRVARLEARLKQLEES